MAKKPTHTNEDRKGDERRPTREEKKDAVRDLTPKEMEKKYGPKPTKN